MTGLNHAITGAVVATAIKQPEIALPAAFLSHFVADMIPHWNYRIPAGLRQKHIIMVADLLLSLGLLILLAHYSARVPGWQIFSGGLLGIAPDLMWLPFFLTGKPSKMHKNTPLHLIRRLHLKIQWSETDGGLFVEAAWFCLIILIIARLV